MKKINLFYLLLILILAACGRWTTVGGQYIADAQNFEADLPSGWRKLNLTTDALLITKDGIPLQYISIKRESVEKELAHTKKKLSKEMLPYEVAELILDNLRSNSEIMNFQLMENLPAKVNGRSGFKLTYTYQTKQGLTKKIVQYGIMLDKYYYEILYVAPARHYFEESLSTFEKVKDSFVILSGESS